VLGRLGREPKTQVDAKKTRLDQGEALKLAGQVDQLYVSKGKKVVHLDLLKDKPDPASLLALMMGPTGNLRAPTMRVGRTLVVGFDEATYEKICLN
jgi:arsenate reductase-like glutaredoxin family protein